MFKNAEFIPDELADWDVSNVNDMKGMFKGATFAGDISNWNVCNLEQWQACLRTVKAFWKKTN